MYCARLWLAWCLVLGAWFSSIPFHSIPSVSAAEEFVFGAKAKISGVFLDMAMLVGAVFSSGGVFSFVGSFVLSFFLLMLLPRDSILFGQKCVFEVQVQVLLVSCDGCFRRRVCSGWYGEF